jgi:glycosidase
MPSGGSKKDNAIPVSQPINIMNHKSCDWFHDAIVYHILIDRFAGYGNAADPKKPVFIGGNLTGIIDRIPYLTDLGINTIWLSPVFKTTAYHGYHITDYYSTDERFGTEQELRSLIDQLHRRGIRVILDFVPNHCSVHHPIFQEAYTDRKSKYRSWFYFGRWNNKYLCFLDFQDLPKINLDFPAARNYMIEAAKKWICLGVDGFRLDHAVGPSHSFWRFFNKEIKAVNAGSVLIGEAWIEGISWRMLNTIRIRNKYIRWLLKPGYWDVQREYVGELDGVLDFYFRHRITEFIAWKEYPAGYTGRLESLINQHYGKYPPNYFLPSFIDNHDMNRFLYDAGQNREKLKLALKLQFSLPHPPILYYGTESGLTHEEPVQMNVHYSDIHARQPMPWNALDHEMVEFCKELIRNRSKKNKIQD